MSKFFKTLILFSLLYFLLGHFYYHQTGDFRDGNILREPSGSYLSDTTSLGNILDQPFTFLGHGNQTFAFVSQDQKYVLKLFKKETLERGYILPPVWPLKQFLIRKGELNKRKMERVFVGYQLGYQKEHENTGLIAVHLSQQNDSLPPVTLTSPLGITQQIDLNDVIFVVQKKGKTTRQVFKELIKQGNIKALNEKINALLTLYQSGYEKGIIDQDHNLFDNTGFIEDQPIRLDLGKLNYNKDPEAQQKDLQKVKNRLKTWLNKNNIDLDYRSDI